MRRMGTGEPSCRRECLSACKWSRIGTSGSSTNACAARSVSWLTTGFEKQTGNEQPFLPGCGALALLKTGLNAFKLR
jgi:hypothetical protein